MPPNRTASNRRRPPIQDEARPTRNNCLLLFHFISHGMTMIGTAFYKHSGVQLVQSNGASSGTACRSCPCGPDAMPQERPQLISRRFPRCECAEAALSIPAAQPAAAQSASGRPPAVSSAEEDLRRAAGRCQHTAGRPVRQEVAHLRNNEIVSKVHQIEISFTWNANAGIAMRPHAVIQQHDTTAV